MIRQQNNILFKNLPMTPTSFKYCPIQDADCWLGSRWNVGFAVAGGAIVTGHLW